MGVVIDGGTAEVHRDLPGPQRLELDFLAPQGVMQINAHARMITKIGDRPRF